MANCVICGVRLGAAHHDCQFSAEARLVGLVEQLHAEVEYLRLRCEEEGVAVKPRECFPGRPGVVPAHHAVSRSPGGESDGR